MHADVVRLVEKNSNLTAWSRAIVMYVVPALIGYLVYDHQELAKTELEIVRINSKVNNMDANGTQFVTTRAVRHHSQEGCHFNTIKGSKK